MPNGAYADGTAAYDQRADAGAAERSSYRDVGGVAFLWIAWTVAFAFWAFTMSTFFGILRGIAAGTPGGVEGGVDAGGAGFFLMDVVGGVIVLGVAMAYALARWATRDRRLDPMTETATAELYDSMERARDDDMTPPSSGVRPPRNREPRRTG